MSGERGESESSIACDIQAGPYRLPSARLRGTEPPRGWLGRLRLLWPRRGRGYSQGP